jgi:hypothetical protein
MSGNALDKMDEFFDFAALEHDSEVLATKALHQDQNMPFQPADDATTMDWATDPTAAVCSVDATQCWHDPMHDASHDPSSGETGRQWPLFEVPEWPAPVNVNSTLDSTLGDPIPGGGPDSSFAPSLSIDTLHSDPRRIDDDSIPDACCEDQPTARASPSHEMTVSPASPAASIQRTPSANRKPASAKRKGTQSRIPIEAKQILEDEFATNAYPCSWEMDIIAHQANLDVKKVRNWFNNTRARKRCEGAWMSTYIESVLLT